MAWVHQSIVLPQGMPNVEVIEYAMIEGTVATIPLKNASKTQFLLELERYGNHPAQGLVQLAWYNRALA